METATKAAPAKERTVAKPKKASNYEAVVIDTINQIQNDQYMSLLKDGVMPTIHKWKDFGVDIYSFMKAIKELPGAEIILILGYEGSGKSYGVKYLNPYTTLWLHADKKPITFKGGRNNYVPGRGNFVEPSTYEGALEKVFFAYKHRNKDKAFVVFINGHIEDYKSEDETRQRLKILGALATKMNIEGSVVNCFYTKVEQIGNKTEYFLDTQNSGKNTARAIEELFDSRLVPNNFQLILDALNNY